MPGGTFPEQALRESLGYPPCDGRSGARLAHAGDVSSEKAAGSGLREFRRQAGGVARAGERRSTSVAKERVETGAGRAKGESILQNALKPALWEVRDFSFASMIGIFMAPLRARLAFSAEVMRGDEPLKRVPIEDEIL